MTFAQLIADNIWYVAATWMGLALIASMISIRLGVSVALLEIGMGVITGNFCVTEHPEAATGEHVKGGQ